MTVRARIRKIALFSSVTLAAFMLTFVWPKKNGLRLDIDTSPRARAAKNREPYDLTQLRVLNRVILQVKSQYVEPERVVPKRMLLAGLHAIERSVAPVLVHYTEGQASLTVQVRDQQQTFRVDDVDSPWALAYRFKEIFAFLQRYISDEDVRLRDVEYSAVNGMLHTLDPHSVLLTPEIYEEMKMSTRGEFGGLGIVISIRDGQLTVIRPMPGTPALRAGLKRGDQIVKINEESTINMPLQEAVNRLRGAPESNVSMWVIRPGTGGWTQPKRFELTRAVIHIPSVESRMLTDGIGFIRIKSFQGNTYEDMHKALVELHKKALKGLVLDLRDNPGGLLDQAVKVADAFLTTGTIVTTSSNDPSQRDEKYAKPEGTEPNYPMIVLINGGSASASEIVSGALKNHDRALIVGQQSFGKGSVQVLYDFPEDGSALKLTVAQYLTPGDVSIQGVGIVPDVDIDPMTVDAEDMDLTVDQHYLREADLRRALTHAQARTSQKPSVTLRYYLPKETRNRLREATPEDLEENEKESEFLTRFSKELLVRAPRAGRREMLVDARPVISQLRDAEMGKATAELKTLGILWDAGKDEGASETQVVLSTNQPNNEVRAGEPLTLKAIVTNKGKKPLYQLRATTKSDFYLFANRELVFGKLNPGETREWTTTLGLCKTKAAPKTATTAKDAPKVRTCGLPLDVPERADGIRLEFAEANNHAPPKAEVRTVVRSLPRPQFAYQIQVADVAKGNGDGQLQPGETVAVYFNIKNVGVGKTYETHANLSNLGGQGVLLKDGRFRIDNMAPGEERKVVFTFEVLPNAAPGTNAELEISANDIELREGITEKLILPIRGPASKNPVAHKGKISVSDLTTIYADPSDKAKAIAKVTGGSMTLPTLSDLGEYTSVDLGNGRPGWIKRDALAKGKAQGKGNLNFEVNHMPPKFDWTQKVDLVVKQPSITLSGQAVDDRALRDVYIFVGSEKVFYQSNPTQKTAKNLRFNANVPLRPGTNYVTVVARENQDAASRKTFVIRRDGPDGALLETPKHDDDGELGEAGP